ncbi:MATE efflux family protein [Scleroderma citrinum]
MSLSGTPSSVPQDYSLLAHYVGSYRERRHQDVDRDVPTDDDLDDSEHLCPRRPIPTIPVSRVSAELPSRVAETTPLLNPPVPRIHEDVDALSYDTRKATDVFWDEIKILTRYSLPVFGSHILEHSMIMASVISIGHISTIALAAATLGFMTANVTGFSIIQGMANTMDTILPSAWTSDQPKLVGLWTQRMTVLMFIVLIPVLAIWFNTESILLALGQEPEIARLAGIYLKWASLGLPAYAFNAISRRYFQSQGLFTIPTRIILCVAPINIFLNYVLVWGPQPARLGFIGAPIASSISYNLVSIASVIYGVFFVRKTAWHPITAKAFTNLGFLAKLSIGGVGQVASSWWSWELCVSTPPFSLGPVPLASQSILISTSSSFFQAPYALGIAASVRIGNLLGEKNAKRAGVVVRASFLLAVFLATLFSFTLLTMRNSWGYLFNDDPEVIQLVSAVLPLVALVEIFDNGSALVSGVLRARGKQVASSVDAYYVIGLPIGYWLTFMRDFQLTGLWWGLNVAMMCTTLIGLYLCFTTDWNREVEKVIARLAVDKGYRPVDEECAH